MVLQVCKTKTYLKIWKLCSFFFQGFLEKNCKNKKWILLDSSQKWNFDLFCKEFIFWSSGTCKTKKMNCLKKMDFFFFLGIVFGIMSSHDKKNSQYSKKTPWTLFFNYYYYFHRVHFLNVDTIIGGHLELKVRELLIKPNLIWNLKKNWNQKQIPYFLKKNWNQIKTNPLKMVRTWN